MPDGVTEQLAPPVNCALSQVTYGLQKVGMRDGDTVVIQGAGGLGLNAVAVAKEMGADALIVIDGIANRLHSACRGLVEEQVPRAAIGHHARKASGGRQRRDRRTGGTGATAA